MFFHPNSIHSNTFARIRYDERAANIESLPLNFPERYPMRFGVSESSARPPTPPTPRLAAQPSPPTPDRPSTSAEPPTEQPTEQQIEPSTEECSDNAACVDATGDLEMDAHLAWMRAPWTGLWHRAGEAPWSDLYS